MSWVSIHLPPIHFGWFRKSPKPTVLLVEDDPADTELISVALREAGYEVEPAKTAMEALGVLHHNGRKFRFALIDIGLPYMDGVTLATKIHAAFPSLRIFLISGATPPSMPPGIAFGVIIKPSEWLPVIRDIQTRWLGKG